jgi:hypothetical protein
MASFCRRCGHPVRKEAGEWVHCDEHLTHRVSLLPDEPVGILAAYRRLKSTPSGRRHAIAMDEVRRALWDNLDEAYAIMTDAGASEIHDDLLTIMGHGGSVLLKDNLPMVPFLSRLYASDKLPLRLYVYLDWLIRVHEYPIEGS